MCSYGDIAGVADDAEAACRSYRHLVFFELAK